MQKLSKDASLTLNDLYDRCSNRTDINDARKKLSTKRGRAMDVIPPKKLPTQNEWLIRQGIARVKC